MTVEDRVRALIQKTFGECPEGLAERVISLVSESANVARESKLETDMLPGAVDTELSWVLGKVGYGRVDDVKRMEANLGTEGQDDGRDGSRDDDTRDDDN